MAYPQATLGKDDEVKFETKSGRDCNSIMDPLYLNVLEAEKEGTEQTDILLLAQDISAPCVASNPSQQVDDALQFWILADPTRESP